MGKIRTQILLEGHTFISFRDLYTCFPNFANFHSFANRQIYTHFSNPVIHDVSGLTNNMLSEYIFLNVTGLRVYIKNPKLNTDYTVPRSLQNGFGLNIRIGKRAAHSSSANQG